MQLLRRRCAVECLPTSYVASDILSLIGWDSATIAQTLIKSLTFIGFSVRERRRLITPARAKWNSHGTGSVQEVVYYKCILDSAPLELLGRWLNVLCPGHSLDIGSASWFFRWAMRHQSATVKIMALRTILHSWSTSSRYHEMVTLGCVFGCRCLGPSVNPLTNLWTPWPTTSGEASHALETVGGACWPHSAQQPYPAILYYRTFL